MLSSPDTLDAAARRLADRLLSAHAPDRAYGRADLDALPVAVARVLAVGLDHTAAALAREAVAPETPWLDASDPALRAAVEAWTAAARGAVRYPADAWAEAVAAASHVALRLLVSPADGLAAVAFDGVATGEARPAADVLSRVGAASPYAYLPDVAARYVERKEIATLDRAATERLLARIDRRMADTLAADDWLALAEPLFETAGPDGAPPDALPAPLVTSFFEARGHGDRLAALSNEPVSRETLRAALAAWEPDAVFEPDPPPVEAAAPEPTVGEPAPARPEPDAPAAPDAGETVEAFFAARDDAPAESASIEPAPVEPEDSSATATVADDSAREDLADTNPGVDDLADERSVDDASEAVMEEPAGLADPVNASDRPPQEAPAPLVVEDEPWDRAPTFPEREAWSPPTMEPAPEPEPEPMDELEPPVPTPVLPDPLAPAPALPPLDDTDEPLWRRLARRHEAGIAAASAAGIVAAPPAAPGGVASPGASEPPPLWQRFSAGASPAPDDAPADTLAARYLDPSATPAVTTPTVASPAISPAPESPMAVEARVLGAGAAERRVWFVTELFEGDREAYHQTLAALDGAATWTEATQIIARDIFRRYRVQIYSDPAVAFTDAVEAQMARRQAGA